MTVAVLEDVSRLRRETDEDALNRILLDNVEASE